MYITLQSIVPGTEYTYEQYQKAAQYANEHGKIIAGYNSTDGFIFGDQPPIATVAPDVLEQLFVDGIQAWMDAFAKTRKYGDADMRNNMLAACSYATSTLEQFRKEGQYCVEMRDKIWARAYELLAEVEAGTRPIPESIEEILTELPVLEWPS